MQLSCLFIDFDSFYLFFTLFVYMVIFQFSWSSFNFIINSCLSLLNSAQCRSTCSIVSASPQDKHNPFLCFPIVYEGFRPECPIQSLVIIMSYLLPLRHIFRLPTCFLYIVFIPLFPCPTFLATFCSCALQFFLTFTFMDLADTFFQSDLRCIQDTILDFISSCFSWESNPWPCRRYHAHLLELQESYSVYFFFTQWDLYLTVMCCTAYLASLSTISLPCTPTCAGSRMNLRASPNFCIVSKLMSISYINLSLVCLVVWFSIDWLSVWLH